MGRTSPNALSQPAALAQGAISGKAERGRGHLAGKGQPHTQAAPKGAQAARGHKSGGHHAAAGTGRAALSGTCASTQPPILQVGDWQGWSGRRAGRAERERQPCWPLSGARSPRPAPRVHAHGPARVHTDLQTHTRVYTDLRTCAQSGMHTDLHTHTYTHVLMDLYTHVCRQTCAHGVCTSVCTHTAPASACPHTHKCTCMHRDPVHTRMYTEPLYTRLCAHTACTPHAPMNAWIDILYTCTYNATDARAALHQDGHARVPGSSPAAGSAHTHTGTHACAHADTRQPRAQPWHSL